jgi:hypothetical protein
MYVGFKDSAFVLAMSTVFDGTEKVTTLRKRPVAALAKMARKAFEDQPITEKEIPLLYHRYNININSVDTRDQLRSYKNETVRRRRGGWQAVDGFLLVTVLTNSYLITLHADYNRELKMRSQDDFRRDIMVGLFKIGNYVQVLLKRQLAHSQRDYLKIPIHRHTQVKMPTRKDCAACKGSRYGDNPPKRVALAEVAANQRRSSKRKSSSYGCKQCSVNLCNNSICFSRYYQK